VTYKLSVVIPVFYHFHYFTIISLLWFVIV